MELDAEIMRLADGMQEELTRQRRDLHQHPEPGWTEFRTASIVAKTLTELGWEVHTGREVMEENARMGVPSPDVLAREKERAAREGADPQWLYRHRRRAALRGWSRRRSSLRHGQQRCN